MMMCEMVRREAEVGRTERTRKREEEKREEEEDDGEGLWSAHNFPPGHL